MKFGDIVVVPFPFSDLSDSKVRPAFVASSDIFHSTRNLLLVAISTKKGRENISVSLGQDDLVQGKINKDSFIRFQNIFTLEHRMVIKKVGRVEDKKRLEIKDKLHELVG